MAAALRRARDEYETFGQIVSPPVRNAILQRYPGLGGEVKEITVLFADIRGFTRRSTGEPPERVVELLNRFLTLAVAAVEDNGGEVNKFLGDGLLALFNAEPPCLTHADCALTAACELLERLDTLNEELTALGQEGLRVGVGIHTGPALVGCVGASIPLADGRQRLRREFTAIGETVNLAQRVEQLTKEHGGPILLSEATYQRLQGRAHLSPLGPVTVPGYDGPLVVYRVDEA
jgi:adenylate cyclase